MEGRLTLCNLSIEMGARGGFIAPDDKTFEYIKGRPYAPKGEAWDKALAYWKTLRSGDDAVFDKEVRFEAADIEPMITYGTNPGMGIGIGVTRALFFHIIPRYFKIIMDRFIFIKSSPTASSHPISSRIFPSR